MTTGTDTKPDARRAMAATASAHLAQAQSDLVAALAQGLPAAEILQVIAVELERACPEARCSIHLGEAGGGLTLACAGRLPAEFRELCAGAEPPDAEWTAAAASARRPVIAADFAASPAAGAKVARHHGLHACWAQPFQNPAGEVLGVLTLYFTQAREPSASEREAVAQLLPIAIIAAEQRRAAAALTSAEKRMTSIAASLPGVVYQRVVRPDGDIRYTYISESARDLFEVEPDEIVANPAALFSRHSDSYRANFRERLLAASRELAPWDVEATLVTPSGKTKYTHALARPHREPDGTVVWNGVILETTRLKEAELAANAIQARVRQEMVDSLPQGFAMFDANDRLVIWNSKLPGYFSAPESIAASASYEAIARAEIAEKLGGDAAAAAAALGQRMESHKKPEFTGERELGDGRWILTHERRTADGGTVLLYTDVSDLKRREAELLVARTHLRERVTEVKATRDTLREQRDELRALTENLARARDAAEAANRTKSAFLANMSHELRTPLNAIIGFSELMKSQAFGPLGNERYEEYMGMVHDSGKHLLGIINDILDLSKVEAGEMKLRESDVSLADISAACERLVAERATKAGVTLTLTVPDGFPEVRGDEVKVKQMVLNLLTNAIKFSKPGGTIDVSGAVATNGDLQVAVTDTGIGIAKENIPIVLQPFRQVEDGLARTQEGTGLGLPLVKAFVELHGGSLEIESELGKGTKVTLCFPAERVIAGNPTGADNMKLGGAA